MSREIFLVLVVFILFLFPVIISGEDVDNEGDGKSIETAIIVESINEEYSILESTQCECGGYFHSERQELLVEDGHYYDLLYGVCDKCGKTRVFYFNVDMLFEGYMEELEE